MKIQISEIDRRIIEKVCEKINVSVDIDGDNWIEIDSILALLDDLEDAYNDLSYEYEEHIEKVKDNYKPCDVNDNWNYYATSIKKLDEECNRQYQFIIKEGLKEKYDEYIGKE